MKPITEKAWLVPLGFVNGVLLEGDDGGLVLIDAGFPNHEAAIFDALTTLGRQNTRYPIRWGSPGDGLIGRNGPPLVANGMSIGCIQVSAPVRLMTAAALPM